MVRIDSRPTLSRYTQYRYNPACKELGHGGDLRGEEGKGVGELGEGSSGGTHTHQCLMWGV